MEQNYNISDQDLRSLLNELLLSESESMNKSSKLMDMETSIVLKNAPLHLVSAAVGTALLSKIKAKLLYKIALKWMLTLTIAGVTCLGGYQLLSQKKEVEKQSGKNFVASSQEKEQVVERTEDQSPDQKSGSPVSSTVQQLFALPFKDAVNILPGNRPEMEIVTLNPSQMEHEETFSSIRNIEILSSTSHITIIGEDKRDKIEMKTNLDDTINHKGVRDYVDIQTNTVGETLTITTSSKKKITQKIFSKTEECMHAEIYLKVPKNTNITIKNSSGTVDISTIESQKFEVVNDYGNVKLNAIVSGNGKVVVESGSIDCHDFKGALAVTAEYGNIYLNEVKGDITAKVESGTYKSQHTDGNMLIKNEYGNVSIKDAIGKTLDAKIESGNFSVDQGTFEQSNVKIEYGNVTLREVKSSIQIKNESGNMKLFHTTGQATVFSNYGNQEIQRHEGDLQIKSNSGKINILELMGNLNVEGEYSNLNLEGFEGNLKVSLNSGNFNGSRVTLKQEANLSSNYGNIALQTTNKVNELKCKLDSNDGTASVNKDGVVIKKSDEQILLDKGNIVVNVTTNSGNIKLE